MPEHYYGFIDWESDIRQPALRKAKADGKSEAYEIAAMASHVVRLAASDSSDGKIKLSMRNTRSGQHPSHVLMMDLRRIASEHTASNGEACDLKFEY